MNQQYILSHADAMKILYVARVELEKDEKGAAVAVVDAHGELLAFMRTDGCRLPSIQIAINKAYTAAREQVASKALGERALAKENGFPMTNFGEMRYVTWGGGVPIVHHDEVVGAVGVSGLPEKEDIEIAKMAAAALQ